MPFLFPLLPPVVLPRPRKANKPSNSSGILRDSGLPLETSNKSRALIFRESSLRLSKRPYFRKLPACGYVHAHPLRKWNARKIEQKKESETIYIVYIAQAIQLGSCSSYRRYNALSGTGRYVINIHKRRSSTVAGDEEARGRSKRQPSGSQELRVVADEEFRSGRIARPWQTPLMYNAPELCGTNKSASRACTGRHGQAFDTHGNERVTESKRVTERCHGLKQIWPSVTQHQTTSQTPSLPLPFSHTGGAQAKSIARRDPAVTPYGKDQRSYLLCPSPFYNESETGREGSECGRKRSQRETEHDLAREG
ncbi:hypothetical protein EAG_10935 [Camponotus floridanus]|uniref:Uncharacterized protein n=1 Tax=Camponotus floridanus TaxID=104421 RepID=E2ALR9_CAMFO|nr:hypothetical protein EAG_10935 [Camponotus floridanus]